LTAYIFMAAGGLLAWSWLDVPSSDGLPLFRTQRTHAIFGRFTDELTEKGMLHTRKYLWRNRWEEFNDSPLWGIGMGVDKFIMSRTEYGTVVVEPGSSWLAILSMTGLIGAGGLFLLVASHLKKLITKLDNFPPGIRAEIAAIGIFWSIHAIAEGWIFAAGSILCLFFWLWLGYVANLGTLRPLKVSLRK
jgi:hypothetical protein